MKSKKFDYHKYVIQGGNLVGDFDQLYANSIDPWNQSREDHILDSTRQFLINWCQKIRSRNEVNVVLELGCGFGYITNELTLRGFEVLGVDVATVAISKAKLRYPSSNFEVSNFNEPELYEFFHPNIIIMSQLTWYILDSLDLYLDFLKEYAQSINDSIFYYIH